MNARGLRRYIDDLLGGRRPRAFHPDDFEAAQIRTAIDLQSARPGNDAPRPEFLSDLQRRLAVQMGDAAPSGPAPSATAGRFGGTRRQVIVGTSAAAAAAAVAVTADRLVLRGERSTDGATAAASAELTPNAGSWQVVASSADVSDTGMHRFELGSLSGFLRRVDGQPEAVSGVCTHQGCKLWFDKPDDRLRCPCHSTSFSPAGQVLSYQLAVAPAPLPKLQVRERNGAIEVLAPVEPA
jgi:cytochrome b6-f complex iron-sulfur subunit